MSSSKSTLEACSTSSTQNSQIDQPTLVSLYDVDDLSAHHCGYCNQNGNISVGMSCELMKIDDYSIVDVIIAVPLHNKKHRKRGYNQSEFYAEGLSKSMGKPTDFTALYRIEDSETQTKKSRYNRWTNVEYIFKSNNNSALEGKHILLVDDVLTTGATMEACIQALLKVPGVKVSVAVMAFAAHS